MTKLIYIRIMKFFFLKTKKKHLSFLNSLANYAYQTIGRAQGFSPFLEMDITQTLSSYLPMPADFKLEEQEKEIADLNIYGQKKN